MSMRQQIARAIAFLGGRKRDYQLCFNSPAGQAVLTDLAPFCHAAHSCVVPGNRDETMRREGRRDVFLRIQNHLRQTPEQLWALYDAQTAARVAAGATDE